MIDNIVYLLVFFFSFFFFFFFFLLFFGKSLLNFSEKKPPHFRNITIITCLERIFYKELEYCYCQPTKNRKGVEPHNSKVQYQGTYNFFIS